MIIVAILHLARECICLPMHEMFGWTRLYGSDVLWHPSVRLVTLSLCVMLWLFLLCTMCQRLVSCVGLSSQCHMIITCFGFSGELIAVRDRIFCCDEIMVAAHRSSRFDVCMFTILLLYSHYSIILTPQVHSVLWKCSRYLSRKYITNCM